MSDKDDEHTPDVAVIEFLKKWSMLDTLEFEGVTVDVTHWNDNNYSVLLNFHSPSETQEPPFSGFSFATQIGGENLQEVQERVELLLSSGMLDGLHIATTGTIWNSEGEEVGQIDWTEYALADMEDQMKIEVTLESDEPDFDTELIKRATIKTPTRLQ